MSDDEVCMTRYKLFYGQGRSIEWTGESVGERDHSGLAGVLEELVLSLRAEEFPIKREDVI